FFILVSLGSGRRIRLEVGGAAERLGRLQRMLLLLILAIGLGKIFDLVRCTVEQALERLLLLHLVTQRVLEFALLFVVFGHVRPSRSRTGCYASCVPMQRAVALRLRDVSPARSSAARTAPPARSSPRPHTTARRARPAGR